MDMICHKTITVYQTVKFLFCLLNGFDEVRIISVVIKDLLAVITSMDDVVWNFWNDWSGTSGHLILPWVKRKVS